MKFGLDDETIGKIQMVFAGFPEIVTAVIYGSRAKGDFKNGSDIDLTLKGKSLNLSIINKIELELDDLLLPHTFDISIFKQISNADLIAHIKRAGLLFYKKV